ncbi:SbcC/MukB-like Walker B domain-containing protein [Ketobacter alkanivorans]|uniref:SMC hinge domain-containing protein n=1 Tax=Ketobacter alkanivorans TaxID=1917421 RepID=A0A2K9LF77_9GAMM|nr:SbcC/MukB-like Walker B domain-containing protein [Ketobacter alkanivorans]AUM11018.1 hypothetical protein Kalk_00535 [Ketobacter alkanivorans]
MKQLRRVALVQFYLHEAFDIEMDGSTAFLGPNGSGKSSTLDAIQIAMLGGNQQYARFNTQSVSSKQRRSLSGYCLGMLRNPEKDSQVIGRARDEARTYIILVFGDMDSGADVLSAGICIEADVESEQHEVKGLFVLPGQNLRANDCIVYDGNDRFPMPFAEFRDAAREQAKKIGRTAIFTDKSGEYVQELLYALNGQRMPDSRRFMSSFVKSMTLKNVDSIDDFVRNYVVEPNPVDIAAFRKQVEQFEALRDLIKRTKARISRLTGILSDFERARSAERRIASLEAIKAVFQVEWLGEQIDELDERIETLSNQRQVAQDKAQQAKKDRDTQQEKVNKLTVQLESDQAEQSRLRLEGEIRANQQLIEAYQHPELARANRLINALRDVLDDDAFKSTKGLVVSAIDSLVQARSEDGSGSVVVKALSELDTQIAPVRAIAKNQLSAVIKQGDALTEESEATRRRIAAAGRTGRLLNDGAALLLELLERAGMAVQPVSALARISRPEWAPALEAYLGGDRDAMVVIEGHSQEAVKILREARRRGQKVDGAAVIQPNHLRQVNTAPKGAEFAVGLLETSNDTARRFLWQKFGNIRLVDTEEELETHSRAITRDGMLSQGGLTKSIRVAPVSDLRVGKDIEDTSHLSRHLADIQGQLEVLTKRQTRLETLVRALSSQDSFDDEGIAEKLAEAEKTIAVAKQQLATLDISHLGEIRTLLKQSQASYQQLDEEYTKNDRLAVGLNQQIEDRVCDKTALLDQLPEYRETEQSALKNSLIVVEMMDSLKDEIERSESAYRARIAEVEKKLTNNQSRLKTAEERGSLDLVSYVQDERLDVQVSDMHWHDRFFWASEEKHKLADTQLQNYEAEAEQARLASEETLRSDIAMSLHDRFKEMDLERRERNKILDACPAFTGGERYRFTSSVVPHYESLVRYINQIAQDEQSLSLFDDNADDINETLRELVEAAAESGNASAVLDYRQFFTFDLDILVDGKRVDRMSNRQGAGSNGEHIAPMYVAAGAALAKAYRLHNRKGQQRGSGLICLDEAFHGMDTTNAVATARFLQSIGLQLIMAGPELERTKLAPITQTIYDLDREGLDLLMERTKFKAAANALMVSDMPGENPEVMENAYQQLGLAPHTAESVEQGVDNG